MARVGGSKATLYKFLTEKESLIGPAPPGIGDRVTRERFRLSLPISR